MSRQYQQQDPNYLSSHYPAPGGYPYPTQGQVPSQQPGQFIQPSQPLPISREYSDHSSQPGYTSSSYNEGSLQPHSSGRRHSSRSPYAPPVSFPEPGSSPSQPQTYLAPSQTTSNYSGGTYQQDRQGPYASDYHTSTSNSRRYSTSGGLSTGGGSNLYSQGGYNATQVAQPQVWNDAGYDEEHDSRSKAPGFTPSGGHRPICRFPRCNNFAFFDRRINELREWCSDEHMRAAITHRVEKPCRTCGQWPRRNGYKHCSGNYCRYPPPH